jgi:hypothetical protein
MVKGFGADLRKGSATAPVMGSAACKSGFEAVAGTWGGGRDRDRTCDPLHVKEVLFR